MTAIGGGPTPPPIAIDTKRFAPATRSYVSCPSISSDYGYRRFARSFHRWSLLVHAVIIARIDSSGERHAQRPLAGLFSDRDGGGPGALAAGRRPGRVRRAGREPVRHGAAVGRGHGPVVRYPDPLAGLPAHRREGRAGGSAGAAAGPAVPSADAGSAARPSGVRPDHAEFRRELPGPRQCRDTQRAQGHAVLAGA